MKEEIISERAKILPILSGLFVCILIISNILAVKILKLGPFIMDGGTILFPLSYIFGDILTEVYGYKASRKIIWTGLISLIIMSFSIYLVKILPSLKDWDGQKAYEQILSTVPRIALASIIAYFAGEYSNSVIISKLKVATHGKWLWLRTISSTLVGEFFDTLLFILIAFLFTLKLNELIIMFLSNYIFKCLVEVLFTPLTCKIIKIVKKIENLDYYDYGEAYNPLPLVDKKGRG